jgi:hypothetical protein
MRKEPSVEVSCNELLIAVFLVDAASVCDAEFIVSFYYLIFLQARFLRLGYFPAPISPRDPIAVKFPLE